MVQLADDLAYGIMSLRTAAKHGHIKEELIKSEKNLAEAQAIAHLGSWEYDLVNDEEYRSDEFFRILGLPPHESGRANDPVFNYIHPNDRDYVGKRMAETLEKGMPVKDTHGKTTKFIGTVLDITGRKRAVEALRNSKARFRALVETTSDWIWEVDENSVYVYSSPKVRDLLGYEPAEVIGKTPFDLMHPEDAQRLAEEFKTIKDARRPFFGIENVNINKNGNHVTIERSGVPIFDATGKFCGYRGIDRDVTERKKLEHKYLQAQKMEAVGQLAGGIAHDFNNILTAIIGFQHLLFDRLEDDKSRHYAKQVITLAENASNLTRDLLAFGRKQTICPKLLDMNDAIRKIGKLLKRLIGEDIEFRTMLHEGSLPVKAVAGQLEQVFMNLAMNARDAMPNGGSLIVRTEVTAIDSDFVRAHGYGQPGKFALISISDTGIGMDEETRKRVFEPFFTTKEVGKGTGLGLATTYGIVHQHDGYIEVCSEPGERTTFRIYLPIIVTEVV